MNKKHNWLFNFSSSTVGGGLIRILETIKWFDSNNGSCFILSYTIKDLVSKYDKNNKYFFISENKIKRLFSDGYYVDKIIGEIGKPDIYFSYGIPVFKDVGRINWFHISNALTIKTDKISLPFKTRVQMLVLKRRIIKSMKYTDIITGESEFSINLLKKEISEKDFECHYDILPNGYDINSIKNIVNKKNQTLTKYAITIGTYKYKKIEIALELFHHIKEVNNLNKFIIIGSKRNIPKSVINDKFVEIKSSPSRDEILALLYNAEYYISASQIENSSNAVLEALLLSKNIILSNIPSHNEMLRNFKTKKIIINNITFNSLENIDHNKVEAISWDQVCKKMLGIVNNYKQSYNSIRK